MNPDMSSPDHTIIFTNNCESGRYTSANRSFCLLVGACVDDIIGKDPLSAGFWPNKDDAQQFMDRLKAAPDFWETVTVLQSSAGERIPVSIYTEKVVSRRGAFLLSTVTTIEGHRADAKQNLGGRPLEKIFADISACGLLENSIDSFLEKCIGIMSQSMDVSRIYIFQHNHITDTMSNTHEWVADGICPEKQHLQNISAKKLSWMVSELRKGRAISQVDTASLPFRDMVKVLRREDVGSILLRPILVEKRYWGFIGFDEHRASRSWREEDVFTFEAVSHVISVGLSHRQNQEALRAERDFVSTLVQNSPAFFVAINPDGTIMLMNAALLEALDYSAAQVENREYITSFVPRSDQENIRMRFDRLTARALPETATDGLISRQGKKLTVEWCDKSVFDEEGDLSFIFRVGINITEKIELEEKLRRAQHMEAIGTLSGGIAHDFNNILTPIIIHTELASTKSQDREDVLTHLSKVLKGARRARNLVRQILAFSRQDEQSQKPFQLELIVKEALKLLRASIPSTIDIRQKLSPNCRKIVGDPTQIHQVFMNLCTNAKQAMEKSGGILTVEMSETDISREPESAMQGLQGLAYVKLSISDTGAGMNRHEIDRIFEPYYSTKGKREGSGLGLAMVHGIIASHGGMVSVDSEPGRGSTFTVYLPVDASVEADDPEKEAHEAPVGGNERILFVDDEESNIDAVREMLANLGYTVSATTSSREALDMFARQPGAFDLVITDQTMPEMTGAELARRLLAISPDLAVIICTGYSDLISEEDVYELGIRGFIMKPFEIKEVCRNIRKALE
jgi:PAS domain S-box-containing protein